MGRFVEGQDCRQDFLLPASIDDYVSEDNPVRVIAAFIDELDLHALGFGLLTQAVVAVDGSKFKAVNNRERNYTVHKAAKRIEQVEASIDRYLAALDRADRQGSDVPEVRVDQIREKIAGLRRQMRFLRHA